MSENDADGYAKVLFDTFKDEDIQIFFTSIDESIAKEDLSMFKGDPEIIKDSYDRASTPEGLFDGPFINSVKEYALGFLGEKAKLVCDIPVVVLPTLSLNATTFKSPRGNYVIALNLSSISYLHTLCRTIVNQLCLIWGETPLDLKWTERDSVQAFVGMASAIASNNLGVLYQYGWAKYIAEDPYAKTPTLAAVKIEAFLLLHEYAHILLDHFSDDQLHREMLSTGEDVAAFDRTQQQEFEADHFAANCIKDRFKDNINDLHNIGSLITTFMGVISLSESVAKAIDPEHSNLSSHPLARERCGRLTEIFLSEASYFNATRIMTYFIDRLHDGINTRASWAFFRYGQLERWRGELEPAYHSFIHSIALKPDNNQAYHRLACVLSNSQQYEDALKLLEKAISLEARDADTWYDLGNVLFDLGRYKDSIDSYDEAIKLNPVYQKAYVNRSSPKFLLDDSEGAIHDLKKGIELNPEDLTAHLNIGSAYLGIGRYDDARESFKKILNSNNEKYIEMVQCMLTQLD